jgi:hypothetical protein
MGQTETGKVELGPIFTSITKPDFPGSRTEVGLGGRFTFNLNDNVALEAEGSFFPGSCWNCDDLNVGKLAQGLFGVKAGKRFKKFGIFAKARPGVASFSRGAFDVIIIDPPFTFPQFAINRRRQSNFAFDLGGVIELYHSRRVFTRFDAGDTMIRYGSRTFNGFSFDPVTGGVTVIPITRPTTTRHNFQFSAGVGFRF